MGSLDGRGGVIPFPDDDQRADLQHERAIRADVELVRLYRRLQRDNPKQSIRVWRQADGLLDGQVLTPRATP